MELNETFCSLLKVNNIFFAGDSEITSPEDNEVENIPAVQENLK